MATTLHAKTIVWFRRDLRVADHHALTAAIERGGPVLAVFVRDAQVDALGAAAQWRLGAGLAAFRETLQALGNRLILRSGEAQETLQNLVAETGATAVYWSRAYDPESKTRDAAVKNSLKAQGVEARSFSGHLLFEPWKVVTQTGGFYRVYTPLWNAVKDIEIARPLPALRQIPSPDRWPRSEPLESWNLGASMQRGAAVVRRYACIGEIAAQDRLEKFIADAIADYQTNRDKPALSATSGLSENLTFGEISPRICWNAGLRARHEGKRGAEKFLKELVWREFAYHLLHHTPHIMTENWRPEWDAFGWSEDEDHPHITAWKRGRTGVAFVDAAMRQMYVTGTMHNRGRMIVASYLTKHLMFHWKIGKKWFDECLIDWDPASNALGWQWTAGSGPDAAPYFRIFNPDTQLEKFDPERAYVNAWIAEGQANPPQTALDYFAAIPHKWGLDPDVAYPEAPIVSLPEGRQRALAAYEARKF